jgi:hypothetical protein
MQPSVFKRKKKCAGHLAQACNPDYLGGWDQEDHSSRSAQANSWWAPISKITRAKWTGYVAQVVECQSPPPPPKKGVSKVIPVCSQFENWWCRALLLIVCSSDQHHLGTVEFQAVPQSNWIRILHFNVSSKWLSCSWMKINFSLYPSLLESETSFLTWSPNGSYAIEWRSWSVSKAFVINSLPPWCRDSLTSRDYFPSPL